MCNFVNCSILSDSIGTLKLNGNAWALSPATWTDIKHDGFRIGDDLGAVLDQYLGKEHLKELIMEEGNVFNNDLP
jgi:hypothetical protein